MGFIRWSLTSLWISQHVWLGFVLVRYYYYFKVACTCVECGFHRMHGLFYRYVLHLGLGVLKVFIIVIKKLNLGLRWSFTITEDSLSVNLM